MANTISGEEFLKHDLADWRYLRSAIHARFGTGDFLGSLQLANAIGDAAEEMNHHPDLDVRYGRLDIKLSSHDVAGVTARDVDLARVISDLAAAQGCLARPVEVTSLELALDTPDLEAIKPFWSALLGMADHPREDDLIVEQSGQLPNLWFQATDSAAPDRQRFHLDVFVPHDRAEERIAAAVAAGGRLVTDEYAPCYWVLEDAEGNHGCVCTGLETAD
jgi:4a-hydroxytetrahydrobiopterin dehydratase